MIFQGAACFILPDERFFGNAFAGTRKYGLKRLKKSLKISSAGTFPS